MTLLLICAAILLFNVWAGYRTGGLAQLGALLALTASYAAAAAVAAARPTFASLSVIPMLLQPYVLAVGVGMVLYAVLSFLCRRALYRMDAAAYLRRQQEIEALAAAGAPPEELPRAGDLRPVTNSPANRFLGLVFGTVKGALVCAVVLVIAYVWGTLAQATQTALHPVPGRHQAPGPMGGMFLGLGKHLRNTPVGALADSVAPLKARQVEMIGRLERLGKNKAAAKRFGSDPRIQELGRNPGVRKLLEDPRIAHEVEQQRWTDLMNEPAVAKLLHDRALRRQLDRIDFEQILNEALKSK